MCNNLDVEVYHFLLLLVCLHLNFVVGCYACESCICLLVHLHISIFSSALKEVTFSATLYICENCQYVVQIEMESCIWVFFSNRIMNFDVIPVWLVSLSFFWEMLGWKYLRFWNWFFHFYLRFLHSFLIIFFVFFDFV